MNGGGPAEVESILLIEDEPGDIAITRRAFDKAGIANPLRVVRDGEEAMEFLTQTGRYAEPDQAPRPVLILLDLNLPRLDGREVLKRLKKDKGLSRIPVVVLTTSGEESDVLFCYENGANTYVVKPVDFASFLDAVVTISQYWLSLAVLPCQNEH